MLYWDGSTWVYVEPGSEGQVLTFINGIPTWNGEEPATPEVLNPTTGRYWMDRNLGASQVATSSIDEEAYGDLYQWGRGTDGHEKRTSETTSETTSDDNPGHGNFILVGYNPYSWHIPINDDLWQGVNGINNPCPTGYRIPTEAEWVEEIATWSSGNAAGAFASSLKLPVSGNRNNMTGMFLAVGVNGHYWSSTISTYRARRLDFDGTYAQMGMVYRASGMAVRCIKD